MAESQRSEFETGVMRPFARIGKRVKPASPEGYLLLSMWFVLLYMGLNMP